MLKHPENYLETLSLASMERILENSQALMEKSGLLVQSSEMFRALQERQEPGLTLEPTHQKVLMAPDWLMKQVAKAPPVWTHQARNPERTIEIGGRNLCVAPGYGSAFVADLQGRRRSALLSDYEALTILSQNSPLVDLVSGLIVEPADVPVEKRPAVMTAALLKCSDKPIMGAVTGAEGALASFETAKIVLGELKGAWVLGLININSPLRLDARMADALWQYILHGQPVIITPAAGMGMTGPATVAGNMAQSYAELLGVTALTQFLNPGHPIIVGIGSFGTNLATGSPGFGRPETALACLIGAQIARHLKLPYRCSAAVTSAMLPDGRAALEHMITCMAAFGGGASLALQAAGILDCINSMSYEQFIIDLEIWGYVERLSRQTEINDETLAFELIASRPDNFMGQKHTAKHCRRELYEPLFGKAQKLDNIRDLKEMSAERVQRLTLESSTAQPLDPQTLAELDRFVG